MLQLFDGSHGNRRRLGQPTPKGRSGVPYINHPIALAKLLATTGGGADITVLRAAVLHDTIEDTKTTHAELAAKFGAKVADIVLEVTDDKSLPKQRRKELQIEHAHPKSREAALANWPIDLQLCDIIR